MFTFTPSEHSDYPSFFADRESESDYRLLMGTPEGTRITIRQNGAIVGYITAALVQDNVMVPLIYIDPAHRTPELTSILWSTVQVACKMRGFDFGILVPSNGPSSRHSEHIRNAWPKATSVRLEQGIVLYRIGTGAEAARIFVSLLPLIASIGN